jgi:hypothetical protein
LQAFTVDILSDRHLAVHSRQPSGPALSSGRCPRMFSL